MNTLFPFGFPLPTAFYLTLFVLTLLVHVIFMNYVLAGSAYLAWVSLFSGGMKQRQKAPTALVLRDWMPFAIGGAITAGVAPLLFVQILYKQPFYTANLLLSHRWMMILPVLIVAFYLTYLLKTRLVGGWPAAARILVGVGAFVCLAFIAYSWTENHVLILQGQEAWADFYARGAIVHFQPSMIPRLAVLFFGAFPTMAVLVGWQLWGVNRRTGAAPSEQEPAPLDSPVSLVPRLSDDEAVFESRRLAAIAFAGLLAALVCGLWYFAIAGEAVRGELMTLFALPWFLLALAGLVLQATAWAATWQQGRFRAHLLSLASAGGVLSVLGAAVVREAIRLTAMDVTAFYAQHEDAARVGGLVVFLVFAIINGVLIAIGIRTVIRGRTAAA
jgi:hypothetical protein